MTTTQRVYGRIKPGTHIFQDFRGTVWPYTVGEHFGAPPADPNTRFCFTKSTCGNTKAVADGFGVLGSTSSAYGNGAVYIVGKEPTP